MTDITATATIAARRLKLPSLTVPLFPIGAAIVRMPWSIGRAFAMVYVDPYAGHVRRQERAFDDEGDGRDPGW